MTDLFKITQPFDSFEVAACFPLRDKDGENDKRKNNDHPRMGYQRAGSKRDMDAMKGMVYTVYGYRDGMGAIAIGDFIDAETARAVAEALAMTSRGVDVVDLIPDSDIALKKREDEGPRWVLEHELESVTS